MKSEVKLKPMLYMNDKQIMNSIDTKDSNFQYAVDTLTQIDKEIVTKAKYFTIAPSKILPVRVGYGSFQQSIIRNVVADLGDNFDSGVIATGNSPKLSESNIVIKQVSTPIKNWAKAVSYNIFEVYQALTSMNIDLIQEKSEARKRGWDLGIQEMAFLGSNYMTDVTGLLNNASVTVNTTKITKNISTMDATEFSAFVTELLAVYQTATNNTAYPNRFVIPSSDYIGLGSPVSASFPNVTKLDYLKDAFGKMLSGFGVNDFEIVPLPYCEKAQMTTRGVLKYRYCLFNANPETLTMNIPVDFTATQFNTLNNFNFQNIAYGQFSGVAIYRPLEVVYFDHT
jgi:hypothetical protein